MSARVADVARAVLNTLQRHAWDWRDYSQHEITQGVVAAVASLFVTSEQNTDEDLGALYGLMVERVELLRSKGPAY
jgi:hypothetical protein